MNKDFSISCILTVYNGTDFFKFEESFFSILNQNYKAREIIIVIDGVLEKNLKDAIFSLAKGYPEVKVILNLINRGPGFARHWGILNSTCKYIAIMDSDDKSSPDRFYLQIQEFKKNNDLALCGGYILENAEIHRRRVVPLSKPEIINFSKRKSPFNNVTVMFNKEYYFLTGGYPYKRTSEDYQLWLKFIQLDLDIININKDLVIVDFDDEAIKRRQGIKIFKDDIETQTLAYNANIITGIEYIRNMIMYSIYRFFPVSILKLVIRRYLRG
ncbi:TPA: glycosyltransferase [Photobacterium damselae]